MALKRHKSSLDDSTNLLPHEQSQDEKASGSTEEFRDDVNVLWDYNSPRSKPKPQEWKSGKRKLQMERYITSPKVPLRKHLSENDKQVIKQDFSKLREDMRALKAAMAKPDHETSLVLSPREEMFFKIDFEEAPPDDFDEVMNFDPFDDSMDNKLLTFSQQINENPRENLTNCDIDRTKVKARLEDSEVFNDSFDDAMGNLDSDYMDQLTQIMDLKQSKNVGDNKQSITNFPSSSVTPHYSPEKSSNKCVQSENSRGFPGEKLQEIEKKRLEALAKLEANKKRPNPTKIHETASTSTLIVYSVQENKHVQNFYSDSQSEFSKEKLREIEKKRLEALAKLESNKKSLDPDKTIEIPSRVTLSPEKKHVKNFYSDNTSEFSKEKLREIEKKRLEAMAKLEANKKRLDPDKTIEIPSRVTLSPENKLVPTFYSDNTSEYSKEKIRDIEKKRLEALAKLEANKKRLDSNKTKATDVLHCTPEERTTKFVQTFNINNNSVAKFQEIEKKRLDALAKLEANKKRLDSNKTKVTDVLHCTPEERITKSVQTFNIDNNSVTKFQEIEKKKLEALAKLEANKRPNKTPEPTPSSSNSPLRCTPDEIEKKRLEALAKREAKRQLEIIEKKKLEALKRREQNQKKMRLK